jgi:hypothetical protein
MTNIYHVFQYNSKINEKCALYYFFNYLAVQHVFVSSAVIRATVCLEDYKVITN